MSKEAFLFPGQGSQKIGMADSILTHPDPELSQIARHTFEEAGDIMHEDYEAIWDGTDPGKLDRTLYTQPAIYVLSTAMDRMLRPEPELAARKPAVMVGHSLGEYSAATAAGSLPFSEGLPLVSMRGELMEEAMEIDRRRLETEHRPEDPGRMAAILGVSLKDLEELLHEKDPSLLVDIANINAPGQVIISGRQSGIDYVRSQVTGKVKELVNISIASHSPLMQPAEEVMRELLAVTTIYEPNIPLLANTSAEYLYSAKSIREELGAQMTGRVRWQESMEKLSHHGITKAVEVGPGEVLSNLAKRIDPAPHVTIFSKVITS